MSTGKPIYYYDGQQLNNERFFKFKGEHRVEGTLPNGERVVVPAKDITTERPTVAEHTKQELPTEIKAEFGAKTEEAEEPKVEEPAEEVAEEELEEVEEPLTMVKVIDLDGNEDEDVYDFDSQEFTDLIEKHRWDIEAIERVLNNEQKTHKGFSFELV